MTRVVNRYKEPFDVYIGRDRHGKVPPPPEYGCFGNPYDVKTYGHGRCIELFERYFYARIIAHPKFREAVFSLQGKTLGCFCVPKRCHGDIYVEFLNRVPTMDQLDMYVVTYNPSDYPEKYVCRRHTFDQDRYTISGEFWLGDTLEEVRRQLPLGLHCSPRTKQDDPVIVETWL